MRNAGTRGKLSLCELSVPPKGARALCRPARRAFLGLVMLTLMTSCTSVNPPGTVTQGLRLIPVYEEKAVGYALNTWYLQSFSLKDPESVALWRSEVERLRASAAKTIYRDWCVRLFVDQPNAGLYLGRGGDGVLYLKVPPIPTGEELERVRRDLRLLTRALREPVRVNVSEDRCLDSAFWKDRRISGKRESFTDWFRNWTGTLDEAYIPGSRTDLAERLEKIADAVADKERLLTQLRQADEVMARAEFRLAWEELCGLYDDAERLGRLRDVLKDTDTKRLIAERMQRAGTEMVRTVLAASNQRIGVLEKALTAAGTDKVKVRAVQRGLAEVEKDLSGTLARWKTDTHLVWRQQTAVLPLCRRVAALRGTLWERLLAMMADREQYWSLYLAARTWNGEAAALKASETDFLLYALADSFAATATETCREAMRSRLLGTYARILKDKAYPYCLGKARKAHVDLAREGIALALTRMCQEMIEFARSNMSKETSAAFMKEESTQLQKIRDETFLPDAKYRAFRTTIHIPSFDADRTSTGKAFATDVRQRIKHQISVLQLPFTSVVERNNRIGPLDYVVVNGNIPEYDAERLPPARGERWIEFWGVIEEKKNPEYVRRMGKGRSVTGIPPFSYTQSRYRAAIDVGTITVTSRVRISFELRRGPTDRQPRLYDFALSRSVEYVDEQYEPQKRTPLETRTTFVREELHEPSPPPKLRHDQPLSEISVRNKTLRDMVAVVGDWLLCLTRLRPLELADAAGKAAALGDLEEAADQWGLCNELLLREAEASDGKAVRKWLLSVADSIATLDGDSERRKHYLTRVDRAVKALPELRTTVWDRTTGAVQAWLEAGCRAAAERPTP